jgi:large subunit ribosomal protein L6
MSRVAKKPIIIPANVELTLGDGLITIKGPKGSMTHKLNKLVSVKQCEENANMLIFSPAANDPNAWAQAGTARSLTSNMVQGVTEGFVLTLELVGVGYRAQAKENVVVLSLGYSHTIEYKLPDGVNIETPNNTTIILKSVDKQLLGKVASDIRAYRPPEPYKGKGVKFAGEKIARKDAKKK